MPEFFKPIHSPISLGDIQQEKQSEENTELIKEIEAMKDVISSLEKELQECLRVREELRSLNFELEEGKRSLMITNKELENTIHDLKLSKETSDKLCQELLNHLSNIEETLREELKELVVKIAKQLYLTDKLPKEEVVIKALEKVFNSNISLSGTVRIFINPRDYPLVEQLVSRLVGETKNLNVELIKRSDINRGDFLMETSSFWIERKLDDILKEIEEEL
ncbi:FliH/SctL family protein [Thermocrinis sp.]